MAGNSVVNFQPSLRSLPGPLASQKPRPSRSSTGSAAPRGSLPRALWQGKDARRWAVPCDAQEPRREEEGSVEALRGLKEAGSSRGRAAGRSTPLDPPPRRTRP